MLSLFQLSWLETYTSQEGQRSRMQHRSSSDDVTSLGNETRKNQAQTAPRTRHFNLELQIFSFIGSDNTRLNPI